MDFDVFYRTEKTALLRLCFLATLDVEAAADATQEAMLRAYRRWAVLSDQQPGAWVRTVALNLCRSRWRRMQRELRLRPRTFTAAAGGTVRDLDLLAALRALPARQREALVLHYWGDLGVDDCAAVMGVSSATVKRHLSRARDALRASRLVVLLEATQ